VSNFQWVWRYSCLNVTDKKPYKRYEGKTNDLSIAFVYVNDLNKLQQFKVSVQKSNALFNSLGNSTCSSPEVDSAFLLYEGSTIHNGSDQFVSCVDFFFLDFRFLSTPTDKNQICTRQLQTAVSPYYHLLKYLLFLLKHPVYTFFCMKDKNECSCCHWSHIRSPISIITVLKCVVFIWNMSEFIMNIRKHAT